MCTKLCAIFLYTLIICVNAQQVCKYPPNIPYQVYPYSQNDLQNYYRALNNMNLLRNIVYYPQRPINSQYARYPTINSQQSIQNVPQQNSHQRDYFANIPTEIIDLSVSTGRPQQQSNYFKIPTEIIDLNKAPIKRPQINPLGVNQEETVQNKYPSNHPTQKIQYNIPRKIVRNFVVQSKPIETTITRTFGQGKPKVYVVYNNIDSDDKDNDKQTTTTTTTELPETTTIEMETTTVDENPQPISRWFF